MTILNDQVTVREHTHKKTTAKSWYCPEGGVQACPNCLEHIFIEGGIFLNFFTGVLEGNCVWFSYIFFEEKYIQIIYIWDIIAHQGGSAPQVCTFHGLGSPLIWVMPGFRLFYVFAPLMLVQYYTVQYGTVQYCHSTLLHSKVLHSTVLCSTVLHSTVQYRTVLHGTVQYSTVLHATVQYNSDLWEEDERLHTGRVRLVHRNRDV